MKKVIVIGGGAAGMMAAIAAQKNGHDVTLLERNEKLGKKIYITGKGRCNVTNACDMDELLEHICTNVKFLYSAMYGFDNYSTMEFFKEAGCPLKIERGNRVFPVSDHASDVISALHRELKKHQVDIQLHTRVKKLLFSTNEKKVMGVLLENGEKLTADCVIVATGGLSYKTTGSTGDGYEFARETGHIVTNLLPSLVSLIAKESWCKDLAGLSLKNVSVCLKNNGKKLYEDQGEMLFTHTGVSGPLILTGSSVYAQKCMGKEANLWIDLKPALTLEQIDKRLLREFDENKNKQFKNSLGSLFPTKMIPIMISLSGIDPEKKIHDVSKEERKAFGKLMKEIPLTIIGTGGFDEAVITKGGVSVKELNPSTMESKKIKGLYFAGEVMDVDAYTGGYNLQIAWSTGWLAGSSIEQ